MPAELRNYQWELGGVVFGADCPIAHETEVAPPEMAVRSQDQQNPNGDGQTMGVDYLEAGNWQLKLYANTASEAEALDALQALHLAWRGDAYRKEPGKATTLRYRVNNRTRVLFGRPRQLASTLGAEFLSGRMPITANFQLVSELYFDDVEDDKLLGFLEPQTGGFTAPFTTPLTTEATVASDPYSFRVGGVLPTPAMVDFKGPLTGAGMLLDGKPFIAFQNDIPADTTVTVDARPWVTAVRRQDGGGVAGLLSPRSRMPQMLLSPGQHSATLVGSSPTGSGSARIRWRSAYPSF